MKILKNSLLFVLFFIFFLITSVFLYYLYKYPELVGNPLNIDYRLEHYPKDIILQTGNALTAPNERHQHFLNFSAKKRKNVIRIGTFGDSYTFGEEVDKTETYPYQLQQLLNKGFPNKKIEVLNFGVGGAGFQEQYFLWKKYGKKMGLDYILLGPAFYLNRGITFRKGKWFGRIRNRFILSQDKTRLKEVAIKGKTGEERYKNYYKLIPTRIALRYDRRPFKTLEEFLPFLTGVVKNPFYYTKISSAQEVFYINHLLLKQIKKVHNKKILWLTNHKPSSVLSLLYSKSPKPEIKNLIKQYKPYNISSTKRLHRRNKLYSVFSHGSSLYNEWLAKIYFHALLGERRPAPEEISCYFTKNGKPRNFSSEEVLPATSIKITDGQNTLTVLRQNLRGHYYRDGSYNNHKMKNTQSFISFFSHFQFLQSPFFPLSIPLKENMKVHLKLKKGNKILLGTIKALDSHKNFFVFYSDYASYDGRIHYHYFPSFFIKNKMPPALKKQIKNIKNRELFIEDHKIGRLKLENSEDYGEIFIFHPTHKKSFLMMGAFSGYARSADFAKDFPLYIHYNKAKGKAVKSLIPDWRCKKENKKVHLNLPNFEPLH